MQFDIIYFFFTFLYPFTLLEDKINYLLDNGFREEESPLLGKVYISKSNQVRFTISDITNSWHTLRIFD